MQVNLDDESNINVEKVRNKDEYILSIDGRTKLYFSESEMKFLHAMIDSALKEGDGMSKDSIRQALMDAVTNHKAKLQVTLRDMRSKDIAFALWYVDDEAMRAEVLSNMSKRSAEDVEVAIRESIERRIRKERSEGNLDIEEVMADQGKSAASGLLKKVLNS